MERKAFVAGAAVAIVAAPHELSSQTERPVDALARLFTAPALQASWFTPLFLAAVPLERLRAIRAGIVGALGSYVSIAPNGSRFTLTFARGTVQGEASLDASGAFTSLLFSRMQSQAAFERLTAFFATDPIPAAWFSDRFLTAVPIERVRAIAAAMTTQLGAFASATAVEDGSYDLAFARGHAMALIFLGADGKIEGLIFRPH